MIRRICMLMSLMLAPLAVVVSASPATATCGSVKASLKTVNETCATSGSVIGASDIVRNAGPKPVLYPECGVKVGSICGRNLTCTNSDDNPGVLYSVTIAGTPAGRVCIGELDPQAAQVITVGDILRAMRRLSWPASRLVIQPPDGLTLVNFDTNFYTPDTAAVTRRVTLLGQPITIEATPSEFTWRFGDGQSRSTTIPGRAYPSLDVTHNYLRKGSYQVSLATTYSGRFRIGGGAWQSIPGTVTVNGAAQPLRAIEAQPKLVGY